MRRSRKPVWALSLSWCMMNFIVLFQILGCMSRSSTVPSQLMHTNTNVLMSEVCSLAVLECIIQSNGCVRLEDLWSMMFARFQHSGEVLSVIGLSPDIFEHFIKKQPALFQLSNGYVYSADTSTETSTKDNSNAHFCSPVSGIHSFVNSTQVNHSSSCGQEVRSPLDGEIEAVRYFQEQLKRKPERWVPIKSLAGHLSQASASIRTIVGPQSEFSNFLLRHPLFFRIQGELVGLADNVRVQSNSQLANKRKSRPLSFQGFDSVRVRGFSERVSLPVIIHPIQNVSGNSTVVNGTSVPNIDTVVLSVDECKAVLWLIHNIDSLPERAMPLGTLLSTLAHATKSVSSSIGRTQIELMEFIRKYDRIFLYTESTKTIRVHTTASLSLLIVSRCATSAKTNVLLSQRGCIFCVNRLWGIIDLGFHEHVFFDRSQFKHVTDLSKHFQVRETVFFNAVLASKESRAKWRATCVWKETDQLANYLQRLSIGSQLGADCDDNSEYVDDPDSGLDNSHEDAISTRPSSLLNMFEEVREAFHHCLSRFAEIRLANAWELQSKPVTSEPEDGQLVNQRVLDATENESVHIGQNDPRSTNSSPVSELSTLSGIPSIPCYGDGCCSIRTNVSVPLDSELDRPRCTCSCRRNTSSSSKPSITCSVATQTLFTGDIMATKLYHEGTGTLA
ncbi:hypothetical protein PHET_00333 [Paragonimus heterotremus]|uniref:Egal-1 winged helix domain-containing protein n=1 Tax=Paragonimus heterotremus TaxID=100268 RepID=A0A8J4TPZ2_9TREM|nr:hypothetical protein PHET_00333 [Paragonimus heterotremus]